MPHQLPKPIRKQREVLYLPVTGHSAILGTAGSGKTTLALYRAAFLSSPEMSHSGRTLLLTFNQALVTYLKYLKPPEFRNVRVENYHKFARGYLNNRGRIGFDTICGPTQKKSLIETSIKTVAAEYEKNTFFGRPIEFFIDEIKWILSNGISSVDEYTKTVRTGRTDTNLARSLRPAMFEILTEYIKLRGLAGKEYDWDDIASAVRRELCSDDTPRLYRHILIDEGQDFSPEMLRSLALAIPEDGSLTFFGDVAQQIYGQRTSWRYAGLRVPHVWEFKENYRNTRQIAKLGLAISQMSYFSDIADMVEPKSPKADGALPTIVTCKSQEHQIQIALKVVKEASKTISVALLFKNYDQECLIISHLPKTAVHLHRDMAQWLEGPSIYYGTYHAAKGLEFDLVILPFLDADNLPDQSNILAYGVDDAQTHDGRLLYVAVTRAKTNLLLIHSSKLTSLLPVDLTLYQEVTP